MWGYVAFPMHPAVLLEYQLPAVQVAFCEREEGDVIKTRDTTCSEQIGVREVHSEGC